MRWVRLGLTLNDVERLRRLELYGLDHHHPSEEPHRQHAHTLVFHLSDVDTVDASYVILVAFSKGELIEIYSAIQILHELVDTYQVRLSLAPPFCTS